MNHKIFINWVFETYTYTMTINFGSDVKEHSLNSFKNWMEKNKSEVKHGSFDDSSIASWDEFCQVKNIIRLYINC